MLEKLMQAAFITFLLQMIAVLSNTTQLPQSKVMSDISQKPVPIISSTFQGSD
ncbi:hypothetical protein PN480_14130 [Dolichospermum circinale CS-1225]|jgi:hypothetical protein|uniref:Uncharacterized protein n=1 Tax=Dolichospermum circinale CS-537/01 TaxID=3021739 RepID=A0ABT5A6I9_9CYAN|nr:hypothetical protein [Dolichospermum circinale]MBD1213826.1 hypothetical protein [Dolichospermum circinale Clear-D4]MCE2719906.1 hypothetical protein [Anabaena sp. 49628_E55]MDB9460335.1 hypothetical protein [Dolichospermum circinale CS-545/17]MDB9483946.1 hypothetical protein [Dolichospermum circinale CS-537/05]MDB9456505.1 hypothetical protein [Dolichospermum circinale CS-541/06]